MNYISKVAEMLGVEIGEKFNIILANGNMSSYNPYEFKEDGLFDKEGDNSLSETGNLLIGKHSIERIPFKPKDNERYYYVDVDECIEYDYFYPTNIKHLCNFAIGNCFKNRQQAELHKEEMLTKFKEMKEKLK